MTKNGWGSNVPVEETKGGTNQSTYTTGDILYSDASNSLEKLAIGSSTEVLTVTGGVPTWEPSGGASGLGSWVWLNSQTAASDASIEWDSTYITSTYSHYAVALKIVNPASDGVDMYLRFSNDNGSTFEEDFYETRTGILGGQYSVLSQSNFIAVADSVGNEADEGSVSGMIHLYNPAESGTYTAATGITTFGAWASNGHQVGVLGGHYAVAETINAIQFKFATGNITDGEFVLYGIKES